ncbi:hypothetical protein Dda_5179 [Drechslerella dactyloides]|uniref:Uncharacterized protein n=1 Tax=Drechslerella dactyloides TaxID=74499 RepID=A0AAD6J019_DREDA|nr:hypothetical protein Dda_5179 [Drechslerella dactyloides]
MAQNQTSDAFWKAYSDAIRKQITNNAPLSDNQLVYIAPQRMRGILTGDNVPAEVTNMGIYDFANGTLRDDTPIYLGGGSGSYIDTLQSYLSYVDLGVNPDKGLYNAYTAAVKMSAAYQKIFADEMSKALDQYSKFKGGYDDLDAWAAEYRPGYLNAKNDMSAALGKEMNLSQQVNGPKAGPLNTQTLNIINMAKAVQGKPGWNMPVTLSDVALSPSDSLLAAKGQKIDFPKFDQFWRPQYGIQGGFNDQVQEWSDQMSNNKLEPIRVQLDLKSGVTKDWSERGFTSVGGDASWSNGWFSASGDYSQKDEFEKLGADANMDDFSITLLIYGLTTFSVKTGQWDIPDIVNTYPKLRKDAPKEALTIIQPKLLAMSYSVGMEVKFSSKISHSFSEHFKNVKSGGASLSLFGFSIGGKASSEKETTNKDASFDESTGTLTIPAPNNGYSSILAVVGEKQVAAQ